MAHEQSEFIPLTLPPDLAGELLGVNRDTAYRMVKTGALPVLPGPGRKKVPTHQLELLVGRRLTAHDIGAARARLAPKREKFQQYQQAYRAAHAAVESKKKVKGSWLMER